MLTRTIAGSIGIAIAAAVIQTGGLVFALFCLLLMLIAYHEYAKAFANMKLNLAYPAALGTLLLVWLGAYRGGLAGYLAAATFALLAILSFAVFRYGRFNITEALISAAGVLYIGLSLPCLMLLRYSGAGKMVHILGGTLEFGCALVWLTFIGTWASDTFAYFAGYFYGKRKLCPEVSPKKTVEGFIGGVFGTVISVAFLGKLFGLPFFIALFLGVFLALLAPLGDLVESALKRHVGIKDSGALIPGHGGVLDRFDSVIFTAPFTYYFLHWLMGI